MNGKLKNKLIGLDSNIFIYHFEDNPEFREYVQTILARLSENECKAITSVISIIETLSYPLPKNIALKIQKGFTSIPNLGIFDVNNGIAIKAAEIRRKYRFRLPDAVQLATAIQAKADLFVTNDLRLKQFKEIPILILKEIKDQSFLP